MTSNVTNLFKGAQPAPKAERSRMETLIVTQAQAETWESPPFQRPTNVNAKVMALANELKTTEYLPDVITLGQIGRNPTLYVVDGKHRVKAFQMSGLEEVMADVRVRNFDTMAEMAKEFVVLNSNLARMKPDDILRGLSETMPTLRAITDACKFVGYGSIRRSEYSPILSMSQVLRCWLGSAKETPATVGLGASDILSASLDETSAAQLITFLDMAHEAWGREVGNARLWGSLNLILCMWLWRKLVLDRVRSGNQRHAVLTAAMFGKCMKYISAKEGYVDWLYGRVVSERDRSPCFVKLKEMIIRRVQEETGQKIKILQPAWASK